MLRSLIAAFAALTVLSSAHAALVSTSTEHDAKSVSVYGTLHDRGSDHVFVKLPAGWSFVGKDAVAHRHDVFVDESTGFVFVKLSSGWKFVKA